MKTKEMNNVEFITRLMDFSRCGALMHGYVITALEKYSEQVIAEQEALREGMKNSLVNPDAWIACAEEVKQQLEENYGTVSQDVKESTRRRHTQK